MGAVDGNIMKKRKTEEEKGSEFYICDNFIDGKFVPPTTGKYMDIQNPSNGSIIGKVALSGAEDVDLAVKSSEKAFEKWSTLTYKSRAQILFKLHAAIRDNTDLLSDIIVLEHGKTKAEAIGSVAKGNETMEYSTSMPQLAAGRVMEVSRGVECKDSRIPRGVCASIVPFNFPMMVPMWSVPIAIATGNCIILKPSEKVPITLTKLMKLFKDTGLPDGVINVVNGSVSAVNAICDHKQIKAVTFVGSTSIAKLVYKRCTSSNFKKCLALGGAKNYLVALSDCNPLMTTVDVIRSYAGCAGQRCMAASVLLIIEEEEEGKEEEEKKKKNKQQTQQLIKNIVAVSRKIKPSKGYTGDRQQLTQLLSAADSSNSSSSSSSSSSNSSVSNVVAMEEMGPVIDKQAYERINSYIASADISSNSQSTAQVLLDGRNWDKPAGVSGFWVGPTVILHNDHNDKHMREEIFGPVLSIYICKTEEEAINLENKITYGNAACVYTSSGEKAKWFSQRFKAAMIGVNIGVPVPREPFSFGGMNDSKFGDGDITGDGGIEFFTERKKITTKWLPSKASNWMS